MWFALLTPAVSAYNGTTAASYADAHWRECPGTPPSPYACITNDCANFASRSLHAGGYPFRTQSIYQYQNWYWYSSSNNTRSWAYSTDLYYFLAYDNPGGDVVEVDKGAKATDTYNALSKGDLLFFDWQDDGSIDHTRVEVGWGTPSSTGYQAAYNDSYWTTGDWADQHTSSRYHDFWNGYWQLIRDMQHPDWVYTVRIYQMHIYSTN